MSDIAVAAAASASTNNRKRARETNSPKPLFRSNLAIPSSAALSHELERARQLQDPLKRNHALNELLVQSSQHDRSTPLTSSVILQAMASLVLEDCLELDESLLSDDDDDYDYSKDKPVFSASHIWIKTPTKRTDALMAAFREKLSPRAPHSVHRNTSSTLDKLQTLQVVLMILRNMSYLGANVRLMAYSPDIMTILIGCLYETSDIASLGGNDTSDASLAQCSLQALVHLSSSSMDWTGQRLVTDKLFYTPTAGSYPIPSDDFEDSAFGQLAQPQRWGWMGFVLAKRFDAREDVFSVVTTNTAAAISGGTVPVEGDSAVATAASLATSSTATTLSVLQKDFVLALTGPRYLASAWSLFAGLGHLFMQASSSVPRQTMLMAMDLLQEFVNQARVGVVGDVSLAQSHDPHDIPSLRAVLVHMPDRMLECLVDCLYIPRNGPDAWDGTSAAAANTATGGRSSGAAATAWKLGQGYDASVDAELRDRALDLLVPLMELDSPRMAAKLGRTPSGRVRLDMFNAVVPILTTTAGKGEASMLATQFLRELSKASENQLGLEYIQERLVELASRDARVSHLVWNHLYVKPVAVEESGSDVSVVEQE